MHLQDEDKVVDRFAALVQEVLRRALVTFIKFEFLDDVRVSEDPQQDLLCDLEWAEQTHLWGRKGVGVRKNRESQSCKYYHFCCISFLWDRLI